jgi:thymidylate synthase (FAD)
MKYERQIGTHGYIRLLDSMGSDDDIVYSARMSYDGQGRSSSRKLIRRMMRKGHTSPFEMCELKFEVKAPIFVARQWLRHRTANANELSGRFAEAADEFYEPPAGGWRLQSAVNKQASSDKVLSEGEEGELTFGYRNAYAKSYAQYGLALSKGVAREIARTVLPVGTYTKFVWKCDLSNILRFIELRSDREHAQSEIADFADVIAEVVRMKFPLTYEAWRDYRQESVTFSRMEVERLRTILLHLQSIPEAGPFDSENEEREFRQKAEKIGIFGNCTDTFDLEKWIRREMYRYPHAKPDDETVRMFVSGVVGCLSLSNSRPAEYANEPWKEQSVEEHLAHAAAHLAEVSRKSSLGLAQLTDTGHSDLKHACVRLMMADFKMNE